MTGSFISSLVIGHRNSSGTGTETEIIVILSSSIFWRTLLRRPRDSEKLFVHEVEWTGQTGMAKRSGLETVSSCVTGETAPSHHPPKSKACSQPWPPLQSALPQAVSPAVQQELGAVMKTTSKTSASAAEAWQSCGLVALALAQCECSTAMQPHPGTGHCTKQRHWEGTAASTSS